jgi:hypothetical protein
MDNQLKSRMRFIVSAFSLALITVTACDTGPVEPVGRRRISLVTGGGGGGGGTAASASIVGTWQRTLVFFDDFGFMHSSETTWDFSTGGTAERMVVTTNITLGASDTVFTDARWRLEGTNLIIDFTAPASGTITLEARVQGTSLFLAGQEYLRIS